MKVLLACHGYPPEIVGGTENSVRSLARGLAAAGHEVVVVAGSMEWEDGFRVTRTEDADPESGRAFPVVRIHRADLYFDHWQKSASARVAAAFREVLRGERPDLVHVHHWIRLSRDLVACAALEGVPAAVTLHDLWTTCLISFRVPPGTDTFCEAALGPDPCLACVARIPPRTPWVDPAQARLQLAEHVADVVRELTLARIVAVPSRAHAQAVRRFLGLAEGRIAVVVVRPGRHAALPRRAEVPAVGEGLRAVTWGHLNALKGSDLVLDAVRRVAEPPRVRLDVVGEAVDPGFGARLDALARGRDVHFRGAYAAPEELVRLGATEAHVMVSGSRAHESWGLVVDEALQLGLPCVLPRSGAFAERADGAGWCLTYEPGDAGSLARVLERLARDPALVGRLTAAVPAWDEVAPPTEEHVERWIERYREVVAQGPPEPPPDEWWRAALRNAYERAWDRSLLARTPEELGMA